MTTKKVMKATGRGGARKNAGRKPLGYKTAYIKLPIPVAILEELQKHCEKKTEAWKKKFESINK